MIEKIGRGGSKKLTFRREKKLKSCNYPNQDWCSKKTTFDSDDELTGFLDKPDFLVIAGRWYFLVKI